MNFQNELVLGMTNSAQVDEKIRRKVVESISTSVKWIYDIVDCKVNLKNYFMA